MVRDMSPHVYAYWKLGYLPTDSLLAFASALVIAAGGGQPAAGAKPGYENARSAYYRLLEGRAPEDQAELIARGEKYIHKLMT